VSERRERSFLRRARTSESDAERGDAAESEPRPISDGPAAAAPSDGPEDAQSGLPLGGGLRRSMAVAAERVDQIITTAHEMAEEIRREAEAEAARLLELRRREADLVVEERLSDIRRALSSARLELDELERRVIAGAREPTGAAPAPAPAEARSEPPAGEGSQPPTPVPPSAYPGTGVSPAPEPEPQSRWGDERAAALIRASQLAVQGESRERIETVLRSDFGLEHPEEIIDEILPRRR
jgi:hypothetical protein